MDLIVGKNVSRPVVHEEKYFYVMNYDYLNMVSPFISTNLIPVSLMFVLPKYIKNLLIGSGEISAC